MNVDEISRRMRAAFPAIPTAWLVLIILRSRNIQRTAWNLGLQARVNQGRLQTLLELSKAIRFKRNGYKNLVFSAPFYRAANPDIASSGLLAWAHFLAFGQSEGRASHPLIDVGWLAAELDVPEAQAFEYYFENSRRLALNPSPYLDVKGYAQQEMLHQGAHPFLTIQAEGAVSNWLSDRLRVIDLLSTSQAEFHQVAGVLAPLPLACKELIRSRIRTENVVGWPKQVVHVIPGLAGVGSDFSIEFGQYAFAKDRRAIRIEDNVFVVPDERTARLATLALMPERPVSLRHLFSQLSKFEQISLIARTDSQYLALRSSTLPKKVTLLPWLSVSSLTVEDKIVDIEPDPTDEIEMQSGTNQLIKVLLRLGQEPRNLTTAISCVVDCREVGVPDFGGVEVPLIALVSTADTEAQFLRNHPDNVYIGVAA